MSITTKAVNLAHGIRTGMQELKGMDFYELYDLNETLLNCIGYIQKVAKENNINIEHVELPEINQR